MKIYQIFLLFGLLLATQVLSQEEQKPKRKKLETALLGKRAQFQCNVQSADASEVTLWWQFEGTNLTSSLLDDHHFNITVSKTASGSVTSQLTLDKVEWSDAGIYSCLAKEVGSDGLPTRQDIILDIYAAPRHVAVTNGSGRTGTTTELSCTFEGRPLPNIKWLAFGGDLTQDPIKYEITTSKVNDKQVTSFLKIMDLTHMDNGTYLCHGENEYDIDVAILHNLVLDKPRVNIHKVVPVATDKIYFNWTVTDWNSPVTDYFLSYRKGGGSAWVYFIDQKIPVNANSFIMRNLSADSTYSLKLAAKNELGMGEFDTYHSEVKTLKVDPTYVPKVVVKGITWNSISLGWDSPPLDKMPNIRDYITYYKITRETSLEESVVYQPVSKPPYYLFTDLEAATEYTFHVFACNGFTLECGQPSQVVKGITEDGKSGPPSNVVAQCKFDNISDMNYVEVQWDIPEKPNGLIEFYNIELTGLASYISQAGQSKVEAFGPEKKSEDPTSVAKNGLMSTRFDFLPANTNFSVNICAMTRRQECGVKSLGSCKMRSMPPKKDQLRQSFQWINDRRLEKDIFRLRTARFSQRSGPVCCIRVIMVKMRSGSGHQDLPTNPEHLPLKSYKQVHDPNDPDSWGAYIAEILGPNFLGRDVLVGDGQNTLAHVSDNCPACQTGERARLLRQTSQFRNSQHYRAKRTVAALNLRVEDGYLDPNSNYTAFVEVVVPEPGNPVKNVIGRSPYMIPRKPGEYVYPESGSSNSNVSKAIVTILAVLASLVTVALCLLLALLLLKKYSKNIPGSPGSDQVDGGEIPPDMRKSFTHFCNTIFRGKRDSQYLIQGNGDMGNVTKSGSSSTIRKPVDTKPILKDDLVAAYLERHRDSDYGFQAEFEQLPTGFPDRTTEICDRPANRPKNRYPDIKCYDQTRVRLKLPNSNDNDNDSSDADSSTSQHSSKEKIPTSQNDYINANFVMGYKDRKKWICAQGPLEHTVQDFWRMVYEQNTEMIIMLTNLEEYNRIKCAQYWPQAGDSTFTPWPNLLLNIRFCTEKRYSDYVIRELVLTATKASMTKAANGTDLDVKTTETRTVKHYHYLQWKDFNAPEHAPAMLKFVKRINEDHQRSKTLNPPILVHCSAGVGRSGTLVAIDGLIQQLREEKQVSIYNTVVDLRHQRNFLVQSVKQFMFVYRAIMEMAQFDDTELESSEIKSTWQTLTENGGKKLELEFARLANMVDDRKALAVGTSEQNRAKNQSDTVIPFDRNRVILTPDGQRPDSTYINASFIEGYYNDESFIITQDPLPSTTEDFWRMVTEHNVCTMVQLNAPTANCPNPGYHYWSEEDTPGSQVTFGSLQVTLKSKDNMPSYVKREFVVYNMKVEEEVQLTHFAYSGWGDAPQRPRSPNPGQGSPEVPQNTTGLLDLVEHALAHKVEASLPGPIAVHCRYGSERSSVFVALGCLVQQLKTESRSDVFTTVRKLRSQRQGMVQHVSQYKFIYRAISDYVDLYRNKDDEYAYSVPVNAVNNGSAAGTMK